MSDDYPAGDYAIVDLARHYTLVGRLSEVERGGGKLFRIEPLYNDQLLPPVFFGPGAGYMLTPCSAEVAYAQQPRHLYQVPPALKATLPLAEITADDAATERDENEDDFDGEPDW